MQEVILQEVIVQEVSSRRKGAEVQNAAEVVQRWCRGAGRGAGRGGAEVLQRCQCAKVQSRGVSIRGERW